MERARLRCSGQCLRLRSRHLCGQSRADAGGAVHTGRAAQLQSGGSGGFQFAVQANAVQTTLIQATTNLADPTSWVTIATNPPGRTFIFTDTNPTSSRRVTTGW